MKTIMSKLQRVFEKLAAFLRHDYLLHFLFGTMIASTLIILFDWEVAVFFTILTGILKEYIWAFTLKGKVSLMDMIFTALPLIPVLLIKFYS